MRAYHRTGKAARGNGTARQQTLTRFQLACQDIGARPRQTADAERDTAIAIEHATIQLQQALLGLPTTLALLLGERTTHTPGQLMLEDATPEQVEALDQVRVVVRGLVAEWTAEPDATTQGWLRTRAIHLLQSFSFTRQFWDAAAHAARAAMQDRTTPVLETEYRRVLAVVDHTQAQIEVGLQTLVESNMHVVVTHVMSRHLYHLQDSDLLDLLQDGYVALMHAAKRYDRQKGARFATYAQWWVRQAVSQSLTNLGRAVKPPRRLLAHARKVSQTARQLEIQLERPVTEVDIARALGEPIEKIMDAEEARAWCLSLDAPIGDDGFVLADVLSDDGAVDPIEYVEYCETQHHQRSHTMTGKKRGVNSCEHST